MNKSSSAPETIPVIGIGASAGGLEALRDMLEHTPEHAGAALVVIQHLASDQKSILHELLQNHTQMPVAQIRDGQKLKRDHVYVAPPGRVVAIKGDKLSLTKRPKEDLQHRPIDQFFMSLAAERGRDAYCVILSGTGSDGAAGLRAIKASGGYAIVQDSANARFSGMPDFAIATGLVDFVTPAAQIASKLIDIIDYRKELEETHEDHQIRNEIQQKLPKITKIVKKQIGHDFSEYKPGTLVRRIERRMSAMRISDVNEFCSAIDNEDGARVLAQEFMISVTQFFRDKDTFESLRQSVVNPILEKVKGVIRIWVPGCATGEEVYTIAMIFFEEIEKRGEERVLQIFGTDIDMPSLIAARRGVFSQDSVKNLGAKRLKAFFKEENGQYRILEKLREMCVFTPHNLLQDPPFSQLDLVSCRNLLIYMSAEIQKSIMPRFHFALRGRGFLLLGSSENVSSEDDLFHPVDKTHRIFQKNVTVTGGYSALAELAKRPKALSQNTQRLSTANPNKTMDMSREAQVERSFLRSYAAPFALISETGNILYLSQKMTGFVQPISGLPSTTIDSYLAPELRLPVRQALERAVHTQEVVYDENVMMLAGDKPRVYDVTVGPCGADYLLSLTEVRIMGASELSLAANVKEQTDRDSLEIENEQLRKQLRETLRQHEVSGQDLKSINEELMSMNVELQSSNEELETSREELQSINEELETVNSELQTNIQLLIRANSDLKNLFDATDVGVIFLDLEFCLRSYTPEATNIYGMRQRDTGRPIFDLASFIDYETLRSDAEQVNATLQTFESEIASKDGKHTYILRIKPYHTTDNRIDGYVLSFFDISKRKHTERELEASRAMMERQLSELETIYATTPVGLALMDRENRWLRINDSLAKINGFPVEDHIGKNFNDLLPDLEDNLGTLYQKVFDTGESILGFEIAGQTAAEPGKKRYWIADFYPVRSGGEIFAVGASVREVTEQTEMVNRGKAQNDLQKLLMGELQHRVKNTLAIIGSVSKLLLRGEDDAAAYQARLEERLLAISRTHDVLTRSDWTTASISEIIANEAKPFQSGNTHRIRLNGPEIKLNSNQSLSLSMAIHELITNAVKYGALSSPSGAVIINTFIEEIDGKENVRIVWSERGGPKLTKPPTRKGFGSLMLERVLRDDLSADVDVKYPEEGLSAEITFVPGPLTKETKQSA